MAGNFRCWVIVAGTQPTAFRARSAEELLPTLRQLQQTQPDVQMKWFERGRLWATPGDAALALKARRQAPRRDDRGRDWRPGGEHKDPRAKYDVPRDEKRARFKKRLIRQKSGLGEAAPSGSRPAPTGGARGSSQKRPRSAETSPDKAAREQRRPHSSKRSDTSDGRWGHGPASHRTRSHAPGKGGRPPGRGRRR